MPRGYFEVINKPRFDPGFRFGWLDGPFLLVGSWYAWAMMGSFSSIGLRIESPIPYQAVGIAIVLPLFAFFLFCNVFRVGRPLELAWASAYVGLMVATTRFESVDWRIAIGLLLVAMLAVIVLEMRRPSYHGVGWQRINPRLPEWWEQRRGSG